MNQQLNSAKVHPTKDPSISWVCLFMLLLIGDGVCPWLIFLKESFDWPISNIFETWGTPQHKSLHTLPSPK